MLRHLLLSKFAILSKQISVILRAEKKCLKAAYSRKTARASSRLKKLYFWCSVLLTCKALRPASSKLVSKSRVSSKKSTTVHLTFTILCWKKKRGLMDNRPFPSSRIPHFQYEALDAQPSLWKWVLFAWEWRIICISKAEHLTSFWYRGPGELGNGLVK